MSNQKLNCKVIEDLYPAYADGLCSAETKQLVEAHLASCDACRRLYEEFPVQMPDADPPDVQKALKKYHRKKRIRRIFFAVGITLLALILLAAGFLCYADGYIPVLGKLRAQSRLSEYSGHKVRCTFDMYNGEYHGGGMTYKLRGDFIIDYGVSDAVRAAVDTAYAPLKAELEGEGLIASDSLMAYTAVDGADFGQKFIRVYWEVWEAAEMSNGEAAKRIVLLTDRLTAAMPEHQITGIQFGYNTLSGRYMCSVPLGKDPLSGQAVQKGTERQERLSEEYLAWRAAGGKEPPFTFAD